MEKRDGVPLGSVAISWMKQQEQKQADKLMTVEAAEEEPQNAQEAKLQEKWRAKWQGKLKEIQMEILNWNLKEMDMEQAMEKLAMEILEMEMEHAMETQQSLKSTELTKARPIMDEESASKMRFLATSFLPLGIKLHQAF